MQIASGLTKECSHQNIQRYDFCFRQLINTLIYVLRPDPVRLMYKLERWSQYFGVQIYTDDYSKLILAQQRKSKF